MKKLLLAAIVVSLLSCDHGLGTTPERSTRLWRHDFFREGDLAGFGQSGKPLAIRNLSSILWTRQRSSPDSFSNPPTIYLYPATDKTFLFFVDFCLVHIPMCPWGHINTLECSSIPQTTINASSLQGCWSLRYEMICRLFLYRSLSAISTSFPE